MTTESDHNPINAAHAGPDPHIPDAGGPRSRWIALVLALVGSLAVIISQNNPGLLDSAVGLSEADAPFETPSDAVDLTARIALALGPTVGGAGPTLVTQLDPIATTVGDDILAAIVAGELIGAEPALERLDAGQRRLDKRLAEAGDPAPPAADDLRADLATLRSIYRAGSPSGADETSRARLVDRYGTPARYAVTFGLPDDHPERRGLGAGLLPLILLLTMAAVAVAGVLAGFVLLPLLVVRWASGRIPAVMPRPRRGGSSSLETFALFAIGFLLLQAAMTLNARHGWVPLSAPASLAMQWLLAPIAFWPLVRHAFVGGEPLGWTRFAGTMGLHAGRGPAREVLAGLAGYLATLPVLIVAAVITQLLVALRTLLAGGEPNVPNSPVLAPLLSGDPWVLLMLWVLTTTWAPLVEELVFRGALVRSLRSRMGVGLAAFASAIVFAFFHAYGPLYVLPLITLGVSFALMRAARGSLIPCITAHAVHNGFVTAMLLVLIWLIG